MNSRTSKVSPSTYHRSLASDTVCELIEQYDALRSIYEEKTQEICAAYARLSKPDLRSAPSSSILHCADTDSALEPSNIDRDKAFKKSCILQAFSRRQVSDRHLNEQSPRVLQGCTQQDSLFSTTGLNETEFEEIEQSELRLHGLLRELEELETLIAGFAPTTPQGVIAKMRFFADLANDGSGFASDVLPFVIGPAMEHLERMLYLETTNTSSVQ